METYFIQWRMVSTSGNYIKSMVPSIAEIFWGVGVSAGDAFSCWGGKGGVGAVKTIHS